jgi:hypothetical protein
MTTLGLVSCSNGVPLGPASSGPQTSTAPTSLGPNGANDTVTLKVSAPDPQAPTNGQRADMLPVTLVSSASTGTYASISLQYRFQVFDTAGVMVQDSGPVNSQSFTVTATLTPVGPYTWRVRAEAQGNVGPWSTIAAFVAPAPPAPLLTCPPAPIAQTVDGGPVAVAFPSPAISNGLPPFSTSCAPPSGSPFSVGSTIVTCRVTDALQRSATCSFNVTIQFLPPAPPPAPVPPVPSGPGAPSLPPQPPPPSRKLSFAADVQPFIKSDCGPCHDSGGGYLTNSYQNVMLGVQPGNANSPLVMATQPGDSMYGFLTGNRVVKANTILQWVLTGAIP